jgi:hypothetical protein
MDRLKGVTLRDDMCEALEDVRKALSSAEDKRVFITVVEGDPVPLTSGELTGETRPHHDLMSAILQRFQAPQHQGVKPPEELQEEYEEGGSKTRIDEVETEEDANDYLESLKRRHEEGKTTRLP